ncbi:MAG: sortase, partial [Actinomycetota bacterium]|nr:sortase [Actinomycetota bacterium]
EVSPAVAFPWTMSAPAIGLNQIVEGGDDSNEVVDTGAIWHWLGSGTPDQFAHIVTFAHRTSKGGTFEDIHLLNNGDIITVEGPTGESWSYSVAGSKVVSPDSADIYAEARAHGGPSISLVACSKADGTPTSLSYRLVVTAVRV